MRIRVLGVLALTFVLVGCGGDGGGEEQVASAGGAANPAGASPTPSMDPYQRGLKYAQCMREHGVNIEDPQPGKPQTFKFNAGTVPGGQAALEKAQEACRQYAPQGSGSGGTNPQQAEAMRKYAQCMRDNGVAKFPDPTGAGIRITPEIGNDPDFQQAQGKCSAEYLPEASGS